MDDYNKFSGDYDFNLWRWTALHKCWNNRAEHSKYISLLFEKIRQLRDTSIKIGVRDATIMQHIEMLSISVMVLVLTACAFLIKMHIMAPFEIVLFCAALFICYKPLKDCSQLLSNINDLIMTYSSLHNLEIMPRAEKYFKSHEEESIRIETISFRYGKEQPWIFQSFDNVIRLNRPVMLQGENGSGKTTLLRILSGLEVPENGNIFMPPKAKEGSFYLSQRLFYPPTAWLEQAIAEKTWSSTIQNFFDVLGMDSLLKKQGHSNGELQRVGLAWAVVSGAPFLFLDEPFAFIAANLREPIFKAFWNATTESGQWWIMASHLLPPEVYKDRVGYWRI